MAHKVEQQVYCPGDLRFDSLGIKANDDKEVEGVVNKDETTAVLL